MTYHKEYRQLWIDAGYPGDMGSACAVRPPPKEYRAVYHFTEAEHARTDIEQARIKVTRISEANDPFELEGLKAAVARMRQEIRKLKSENDKKLRLLCFSKDWRSPALWAHYADRHKGICLGFWAKRETLEDVEYHKERIDSAPAFNAPNILTPRMKQRLTFTKANDWIYEEETRRFLTLEETFESGGYRFFRFGNTLKLSEVILGERCAIKIEDLRNEVRAKHKDVAVYRARSAWGYFKMVPEENTIP